jgi:hypothetical protein
LIKDGVEIYKSEKGLGKHNTGGACISKLRMKLKMASS